jgi:hypothetical protein
MERHTHDLLYRPFHIKQPCRLVCTRYFVRCIVEYFQLDKETWVWAVEGVGKKLKYKEKKKKHTRRQGEQL